MSHVRRARPPQISVVMTVCDGAQHVADAIRSIQAQSYRDWELIAVDNGSVDESATIVETLAAQDNRIRLIIGVSRGRARAANIGVEAARGRLIARMDQDDVAVPDRFAMQLDWMRRTGVEICGGWVQRFGDLTGLMWFPESDEAIRRELLFRCALMQPSVLLHAEILRRHRYNETVAFDDYELWARLAGHYRMGNVPAVLLRYRCHPRQGHIVEAEAFSEDMRWLRDRLFQTLFPDSGPNDADAIARVGDGRPFATLAGVEHAGGWLVRLAQSPDPLLRRRMLERWRDTCRRSAHLGAGTYRVYKRLASRFEVEAPRGDARLWVSGALRTRWDSRLDRSLRGLSQVSRRPRRAPG